MHQQKKSKRIRLVFTVTNDLNYDQRMIRICSSLQNDDYEVLLVGRKKPGSGSLNKYAFSQKRLFCFFHRGKLFYLEFNIRLLLFLFFTRLDLICAIDLDTILPCYFISILRRKKRIYDAHELFCEMKEIVTRPLIYKTWKFIEGYTVPKFSLGYTVNDPIRNILQNDYEVNYEVIKNVPLLQPAPFNKRTEPFILYQGTVNEGRSFETLIPAFKWINCPIRIYGDGNFLDQAKNLVCENGLESKVLFMGKLFPEDLKEITPLAIMGVTLFENNGLSNYYSLANRFFDYIHAHVPQICVDYPAYRQINDQFQVALLIDDLSSESIARTINTLLMDQELQSRLRNNCIEAAKIFNWQSEEKKLLAFYHSVFSNSRS
jgi:glycosyltransferase involved in cell wall biosynthesis